MALHLNSKTALEPREDGVQMLVIDSAQPDLVIRIVVLDDQRAIFLGQPLQRADSLTSSLQVGRLMAIAQLRAG